MAEAPPPVIVVGMHRSGTRVVVEMLDALGVHLGRKRDPNGEALLFLGMNQRLLHQAGGRWDRPAPVRTLLSDDELRGVTAEALGRTLRSPRVASFVGWKGWLRGGLPALRGAWGWKDPRNTFTLPLWLDLFPDARVVEVRRHGVDVAASLRRRTAAEGDSERTRALEGGFSLWEEYIQEAARHRAELGGDRWHAVGFEALVRAPAAEGSRLADFLGLRQPGGRVELPRMRPERALGYRGEAALEAFAEDRRERLARWGYEP